VWRKSSFEKSEYLLVNVLQGCPTVKARCLENSARRGAFENISSVQEVRNVGKGKKTKKTLDNIKETV
jgi:hypothetical protein